VVRLHKDQPKMGTGKIGRIDARISHSII
jgi:hypothetical protein